MSDHRAGTLTKAAILAAAVASFLTALRTDAAAAAASVGEQTASDSGTAAQSKVPGEVMVLHATNKKGGIDPSIGAMQQLKKPPFSAYDTYKLLARSPIVLLQSAPASVSLPNKSVLKTSLVAPLPGDRYRVSATIGQAKPDAGDENFLPMLEVTVRTGETFFVAGQSFDGGILVVGIKVGN